MPSAGSPISLTAIVRRILLNATHDDHVHLVGNLKTRDTPELTETSAKVCHERAAHRVDGSLLMFAHTTEDLLRQLRDPRVRLLRMAPVEIWCIAQSTISNSAGLERPCLEVVQELQNAGFKLEVFFEPASHGNTKGLVLAARTSQSSANAAPTTVITYRARGLGDQLCLTPALHDFRLAHPEQRLAVRSRLPEVYLGNPDVDDNVWAYWPTKPAVERAVDIPASPKYRSQTLQDAHAMQLGCSAHLGNARPRWHVTPLEDSIWAEHGSGGIENLIGFAPFSSWASKEWPLDRWQRVLAWISSNYSDRIVVIGPSGRQYEGIGTDLIGRLSLRDLALLIRDCKLVVSVDNGITHLAAALERPTVALYGPLLGRLRAAVPIVSAVQATSGCVGCYHDTTWTAPPRNCPKLTSECMTNITTSSVIEMIESVLGCAPDRRTSQHLL